MKTFNVTSGVMVCSDPCYNTAPIVKNVKNGEWVAEVETIDERIAVLKVRHINAKVKSDVFFDLMDFDGAVDSGQFGFFDSKFYRNNESAKDLVKYDFGDDYDKEEGDSWYRAVCNITLDDDGWGVLPNGAVSSSGYGDGCYNVYGCKDESGEYVSFYVEYIGQEEDEYEYGWDDEEDEF